MKSKNPQQFDTLEGIESHLKKYYRDIFFLYIEEIPHKDLFDLITKIRSLCVRNPTLHKISGEAKIQCQAGRQRTFTDLFLICRYYRPQTTYAEFMKACIENKDKLWTNYCFGIKRMTVSIGKFGGHHDFGRDEYGRTFSSYEKEVKKMKARKEANI